MDERVKFKCRRDGNRILIDLWFDDCQLTSTTVVGGDSQLAELVESGELHITKDSKAVYEDGTRWFAPIPQRGPRTISSGYQGLSATPDEHPPFLKREKL